MGNGALPNGPSYRAHPRLYRPRHRAMAHRIQLVVAKRKCRGWRPRAGFDPSRTLTSPSIVGTGDSGKCWVDPVSFSEQVATLHCAFIQVSNPISLTDTSDKETCSGIPSAVPR